METLKQDVGAKRKIGFSSGPHLEKKISFKELSIALNSTNLREITLLDPIQEKIEELNQHLAEVRRERDELNSESKLWAEKRNQLNQQIKALQNQVKNLREKRDEMNRQVQVLKATREKTKAQRKEKQEQILKIRAKIEPLVQKKPPINQENLEREIQSLDWKIQTTSLPIGEEKRLVSKVQVLETQRLVLKQLQELKDTLIKLQKEAKALETQARINHEKLSNLAEQSQEFHEHMMKTVNEMNTLKKSAGDAHQKHKELHQRANEAHEKYVKVQQQITVLREEVEKREKEDSAKRERALREEATKKVQEKVKKGQKLTWEEFKLFKQQEETT